MQRCRTPYAFLFLIGLLGAWIAAAPQKALARAPADVFANDTRLATPVDASASEEPFAEFLGETGKPAGVELKASPEVARHRITAFAKQRPLSELLRLIAEHFDYTWVRANRRDPAVYELTQSLAARKRDADAVAAADEAAGGKLRNKLEKQLQLAQSPEGRSLARRPFEEREQLITSLTSQLSPQNPIPSDQRAPIQGQFDLTRAVTPDRSLFNASDAMLRLYAALPDDLRQGLWKGEDVSFSYPSEGGRYALSTQVATQMLAGVFTRLATPDQSFTKPFVPNPNLQSVTLEGVHGDLLLTQFAQSPALEIRMCYVGTYTLNGESPTRINGNIDDVDPSDPGEELGEAPGLDDAAAALPDHFTPAEIQDENGKPLREWVAADFFRMLSTCQSHSMIADGLPAFGTVSIPAPTSRSLPMLLDRYCHRLKFRCGYRDGYLLFKKCNRPLARRLAAPADLVSRWERSFHAHSGFSLEDLVGMAALGTVEGEYLCHWWRISRRLPASAETPLEGDLEGSGAALRCLSALSIEQVRALEEGAVFPVRALPSDARTAARDALVENDGDYTLSERPAMPDDEGRDSRAAYLTELQGEALWPTATLTMTEEPGIWYFSSLNHFEEGQLEQAVQDERLNGGHPNATVADLRKMAGIHVRLVFQCPGMSPLIHEFLVSSISSSKKQ